MPKIQLRIYIDPGQAEVVLGIKDKQGFHERVTAIIDTGAAVSLFPNDLLDKVDFRPAERSAIIIDQAGIAGQSFAATEGFVTLFLEDQYGARTQEFAARVWFADTGQALVGFDGILDRAILHIDVRTRTGWMDIDP